MLDWPEEEGYSFSANGLTLYLSSSAPPAYETRHRHAHPGNHRSPFSGRVPVAKANSVMEDVTPFISYDGLSLYFTSDRQLQGGDIYRAVRSSASAPLEKVSK